MDELDPRKLKHIDNRENSSVMLALPIEFTALPLFPLPRAYFSVLKEENKNPIAEFEYQHK